MLLKCLSKKKCISKKKKTFLEPTGLSNTASYWSVVQEIACKLIEMTVVFLLCFSLLRNKLVNLMSGLTSDSLIVVETEKHLAKQVIFKCILL